MEQLRNRARELNVEGRSSMKKKELVEAIHSKQGREDKPPGVGPPWVRGFEDLSSDDVAVVGGKNASLGEMIRELREAGIRVPPGFATTACAYRRFLEHNDLERRLRETLAILQDANLEDVGTSIREMILGGEFPEEVSSRASWCGPGSTPSP